MSTLQEQSEERGLLLASLRAPATVLGDGLAAGAVGAVLGGIPSTAHALASGGDLLAATEAAGSLLLPHEHRRARLVLAAGPAHAAISLGWGIVLAATLPARWTPAAGALAGALIALLDLGLLGRRRARIARLPTLPQLADHVAFGIAVGVVLRYRRARRAWSRSSDDRLLRRTG